MINTTFHNRLRVFEHTHPISPTGTYDNTITAPSKVWLSEIQARLAQIGFVSQPVSTLTHTTVQANTSPAIFYSERRSGSDYTLLLYNSCPISEGSPWDTLPILSRLRALEIVQLLLGELPIDLKWLIEISPDPGATAFSSFLERHSEQLHAHACLWDDSFGTYEAGWGHDGVPLLMLGSKGRLGIELRARTHTRAWHSMHGAIVPNAAWRLLWALHSIKDENENIQVDGFYDQVDSPDEALLSDAIALPDSVPILQQRWGIAEMPFGLSGLQLHYAQMLVPTCSITRLEGFDQDAQGTLSGERIPTEASAHLDFHLVPRQVPEEIFALLRRHLETHGFQDIDTYMRYGYAPAMPQANDGTLVNIMREVTRLTYATPPLILPTTAGSQPLAMIRHHLRLPVVITTLVGRDTNTSHTTAAVGQAFAASVRQTALFIASVAQHKA